MEKGDKPMCNCVKRKPRTTLTTARCSYLFNSFRFILFVFFFFFLFLILRSLLYVCLCVFSALRQKKEKEGNKMKSSHERFWEEKVHPFPLLLYRLPTYLLRYSSHTLMGSVWLSSNETVIRNSKNVSPQKTGREKVFVERKEKFGVYFYPTFTMGSFSTFSPFSLFTFLHRLSHTYVHM